MGIRFGIESEELGHYQPWIRNQAQYLVLHLGAPQREVHIVTERLFQLHIFPISPGPIGLLGSPLQVYPQEPEGRKLRLGSGVDIERRFVNDLLDIAKFELLTELKELFLVGKGCGNYRHAQRQCLFNRFATLFGHFIDGFKCYWKRLPWVVLIFFLEDSADIGREHGSHPACTSRATNSTPGHSATTRHSASGTRTGTTHAGATRTRATHAGTGTQSTDSTCSLGRFDHQDLGEIVVKTCCPKWNPGKFDLTLNRLKDLGHSPFDFGGIFGNQKGFTSHVSQCIDWLQGIIRHRIDSDIFCRRRDIPLWTGIGRIGLRGGVLSAHTGVFLLQLFLIS